MNNRRRSTVPANTHLPSAVIRLRKRPAVTGARDYYQSLRDAKPLQPASE